MDLRVAHVVTILFTDIEGSTQLARALGPARWSELLADHHRDLREAVEAAGGEIIQTEGDGALAFLPSEPAGVAAARRAQQTLSGRRYEDEPVRVRMGLHTGVVEPHSEGWVGLDLHLAARIAAAANGGQILISSATRRGLGADVEVRDLGAHRLKDFPEPEHLHHVMIDAEVPAAPRTQPVRPTNLPPETRALVGRGEERRHLVELLRSRDTRLVTLTGIGGIGKTRLALQVAGELLEDLPGGAFVVRLAGIRQESALLPATAEALGLSGDSPSSLLAQLVDRLGARPTLLVLDNFEQLVDAAPIVASLAEQAPELRMLVTSQVPLRLAIERVVRLGPLDGSDAVDLFMDRARARTGDFSADPEETRAISEICAALDGMPLAIELAAARLATLGPVDLAQRLKRPLALLTRGDRDLPERHQSLRATFAWTCDLLDPGSRRLLARMAACVGPVPLSMLEALSDPDQSSEQVLDDLEDLLDCSLVRRIGDRRLGSRYVVPQALRDFALGALLEPEEEPIIRRRHAEQVARLAHEAQLWKWGATQERRSALLAVTLEIRPALAWAEQNDPVLHARLAARLVPYLVYRGVISETAEMLRAAWASEMGTRAERARLITFLAKCEQLKGNGAEAQVLADEALALWRRVDDDHERGVGLGDLCWVLRWMDRLPDSLELLEESLAIFRRLGEPRLILRDLVFTAQTRADMRDPTGSLRAVEEAAALAGDDPAWELDAIRGDCALFSDQPERAVGFYASSLRWTSESGEAHQVLMDLRSLTLALGRAGHAEASLEMGEIARLIELETGRVGAPSELVEELTAVFEQARARVGAEATAAAIGRAQRLAPGQRITRALELCDVSPK